MGTYIDIGYTGYKSFHACYIKNIGCQETLCLEEFDWWDYRKENDKKFDRKKELKCETNDKICWTYLLRCRKMFENINALFHDYLTSQNIENLYKIEEELYNFEIPYFRYIRAKPLIIEEIAFELYNEFYSNQLNEDFENIEIAESNFISQRIKPTLEPYLEKCGLFRKKGNENKCPEENQDNENKCPEENQNNDDKYPEENQDNVDKCLEEIISDFKRILLDPDYKYNGRKDTPIEKINLAVIIFEKIVELHKNGKLGEQKLEDFLVYKNISEILGESYTISRNILDDLRELYISKVLGRYEKIKDNNGNLIIRSFISFILLEMHRFLDKKPNVAICHRCKRIFVGEHKNREYCPYKYEKEICSEVGKSRTRQQKEENFPGLKEYNKIYYRLNKRVNNEKKMGSSDELARKRKEEFNEWVEYAQSRRDEYTNGKITEEQFVKEIRDKYMVVTGENYK